MPLQVSLLDKFLNELSETCYKSLSDVISFLTGGDQPDRGLTPDSCLKTPQKSIKVGFPLPYIFPSAAHVSRPRGRVILNGIIVVLGTILELVG